MTVVSAGTAGGQLAIALTLPAVTALYQATEVGSFALVLVYAQVGAIVLTGRLEHVLPRLRPTDRWVAVRLIAGVSGALILAASFGCVWLIGSATLAASSILLLASVAWLNVAGFVVLAGQEFALLARMRLLNGVVTAAGQVVGGFVLPDAQTLILTYALGNLFAVGLSAGCIWRMKARSSKASARELARREAFVAFALTVGGAGAMSTAALALPMIALNHMFSAAVVGSFFIARKLLMVKRPRFDAAAV